MEVVRAVYHCDPERGSWWADSPDVVGWTATAETIGELRALVEDGVRFALDREDVVVEHLLDHGLRGAQIVFDFVHGETIVQEASVSAGGRAAAHWQPA